jgi:hypothetical protein
MDLKTEVVSLLAVGSPPDVAAGVVGLTEAKLQAMREADPQFDRVCTAARAGALASYIERLHRSKDWRAAAKLLEAAPETREQFRPAAGGSPKLEVIININRDAPVSVAGRVVDRAVTIEHDEPPSVEHRPEPEPTPVKTRAEREAEERNALEKRLRAEYVAEHENEGLSGRFDGSVSR